LRVDFYIENHATAHREVEWSERTKLRDHELLLKGRITLLLLENWVLMIERTTLLLLRVSLLKIERTTLPLIGKWNGESQAANGGPCMAGEGKDHAAAP
jgi:hypothetical protein